MHAKRPRVAEVWSVPRDWIGETVAIFGTGPSLSREQTELCRRRVRTIAVNSAFRLAPWADVLYACDHKWWNWNKPDAYDFAGEKICLNKDTPNVCPDVKRLEPIFADEGLSADPTKLITGKNSGYQAINLAALRGAARILLVGFDLRQQTSDGQRRSHFFGEYPTPWTGGEPALFIERFNNLPRVLAPLGIEAVNCTPESALRCFPVGDLKSELDRT